MSVLTKKKSNPYFEDFITMAGFACRAAEYLHESLENFKPETLSERREEMHKIEHAADMVKHQVIKRLVKEFIPPIDREDIIQMANELDNVIDKIEDILIRMYMYHVKSVRPEALNFSDVIMRSAKTLERAMVEFPNFHKSPALVQAIIDVNTMEEEGDKIYVSSMRDLYVKGGDSAEVIAWSELYDRLEDCCDACEHVADTMEVIIMKNS